MAYRPYSSHLRRQAASQLVASFEGNPPCPYVLSLQSSSSQARKTAGGDQPEGPSGPVELQQPRRFEGVFDRSDVCFRQVDNDHHVVLKSLRDSESSRRLTQEQIPVLEVGADHDARVIELPRNQPTVELPAIQPTTR